LPWNGTSPCPSPRALLAARRGTVLVGSAAAVRRRRAAFPPRPCGCRAGAGRCPRRPPSTSRRRRTRRSTGPRPGNRRSPSDRSATGGVSSPSRRVTASSASIRWAGPPTQPARRASGSSAPTRRPAGELACRRPTLAAGRASRRYRAEPGHASPACRAPMDPASTGGRECDPTGPVYRAMIADRGYGEARIDTARHKLGVRTVAVPREGTPDPSHRATEGAVALTRQRRGEPSLGLLRRLEQVRRTLRRAGKPVGSRGRSRGARGVGSARGVAGSPSRRPTDQSEGID
jgi:hypothetical protein